MEMTYPNHLFNTVKTVRVWAIVVTTLTLLHVVAAIFLGNTGPQAMPDRWWAAFPIFLYIAGGPGGITFWILHRLSKMERTHERPTEAMELLFRLAFVLPILTGLLAVNRMLDGGLG
jgi:hypothetical protein